jgi:hypothetical protein
MERWSKRTISAVAGRAERGTALFAGPGGGYAQSAAPDPGSCPVNIAGAARNPEFLRLQDRLPGTRDPLLTEEPVMNITAWIVPGRPQADQGWPTACRCWRAVAR